MSERDDRRARRADLLGYLGERLEQSERDDLRAELEASERDREALGRVSEAAWESVRGHESRFCDLALCSRCYLQSEIGAMVAERSKK